MFVLTILEKTKERRLTFSQRSQRVLYKMASYEEERVKLTNTQLNRLKSAANNNTETTLRITSKNFQDEEFPQELILTTRQAAKTKNFFAKNVSTKKT